MPKVNSIMPNSVVFACVLACISGINVDALNWQPTFEVENCFFVARLDLMGSYC